MNVFEIMKNIEFKHKTAQGKPISCLENLIAVLEHENLKIEVNTVFLSNKAVLTIQSLNELKKADKKPHLFILSVENALALHGVSISTARYLPLVDFRQFVTGDAQ